ncbi:Pycsar system effector family protein [Streptosporangium canum]|uniref:Pycsar system effector family protein n=1 Tax=Streptosporangium canum TaxID=324952 RepID=UPI0037AE0C26
MDDASPSPAQARNKAAHLLTDAYRLYRIGQGGQEYGHTFDYERAKAAEQAQTLALLAIGHALAEAKPDDGQTELRAEADAVRVELARVDTKCGIALALAGTAFSVLVALGVLISDLAPLAQVGLWLAMTVLAIACGVLLWVIRPSLPRTGRTGFLAYAEAVSVDHLFADLSAESPQERLAAEVIHLSRIARTKYRRLRLGIDLMLTALVILVMTLPFGG